MNQQKFSFEYVGMKDGCHLVRAKKGFSMIGYTKTDLGIAKCHFEVGAGKENFDLKGKIKNDLSVIKEYVNWACKCGQYKLTDEYKAMFNSFCCMGSNLHTRA